MSSANRAQLTVCRTPEQTFAAGEEFARQLRGGDVVLLKGGLGAGKTLFTKGVASTLGFDPDEVTSPSFALVNLYRTRDLDVYHIDLWRIEHDAAFAVGLDDILAHDNAVTLIEWPERLGRYSFPSRVFEIEIQGDGDAPRTITLMQPAKK